MSDTVYLSNPMHLFNLMDLLNLIFYLTSMGTYPSVHVYNVLLFSFFFAAASPGAGTHYITCFKPLKDVGIR